MNVSTIEMPQEVAREKLGAVRTELRKRADAEYEALEKAYTALGEGTPILDIEESLAIAGFDETGRPRLAIARADRRKLVRVDRRWDQGEPIVFDATTDAQERNWSSWNQPTTLRLTFRVPDAPPCSSGWALIPMIPPEVRKDHPVSYDKGRFILWEVEEWAGQPKPKAPRDPMLLEPLAGPLYAVLAHWDLTELERRIMLGRRDS